MNETWFELKDDHMIVHREPPKVKGQLVGYFVHPDGRQLNTQAKSAVACEHGLLGLPHAVPHRRPTQDNMQRGAD